LPQYTYIDFVLILTKKWLGYSLGNFLTNSSGHPGLGQRNLERSIINDSIYSNTRTVAARVKCIIESFEASLNWFVFLVSAG
jgi:hypothetical protein